MLAFATLSPCCFLNNVMAETILNANVAFGAPLPSGPQLLPSGVPEDSALTSKAVSKLRQNNAPFSIPEDSALTSKAVS